MDTCCFCLSAIGQAVTTLKCGHAFHSICLRQYNGDNCPLCRGDLEVKEERFGNADMGKYGEGDYVWIFGSFQGFVDDGPREGYLVCELGGRKYMSGYFWRLFDDQISRKLEDGYVAYGADKKENCVDIELGSSSYKVFYEGFSVVKGVGDGNGVVCLQQNQHMRHRPVMRMKWGDVRKNLMVIGVHDSVFFAKTYVYWNDNDECYFFDMAGQDRLNGMYGGRGGGGNVLVEGKTYLVDTRKHTMRCGEDGTMLDIEIYRDQDVCNR